MVLMTTALNGPIPKCNSPYLANTPITLNDEQVLGFKQGAITLCCGHPNVLHFIKT